MKLASQIRFFFSCNKETRRHFVTVVFTTVWLSTMRGEGGGGLTAVIASLRVNKIKIFRIGERERGGEGGREGEMEIDGSIYTCDSN